MKDYLVVIATAERFMAHIMVPASSPNEAAQICYSRVNDSTEEFIRMGSTVLKKASIVAMTAFPDMNGGQPPENYYYEERR